MRRPPCSLCSPDRDTSERGRPCRRERRDVCCWICSGGLKNYPTTGIAKSLWFQLWIISRGAQTASRKTANFIWCLQIQNLCWGQRGTWSWSQNVQNLTLNLKANSRFWIDAHWGWKWRIKLPILNFPPGGAKFSVLRVKFRESKSAIFFGSIWAILLV